MVPLLTEKTGTTEKTEKTEKTENHHCRSDRLIEIASTTREV